MQYDEETGEYVPMPEPEPPPPPPSPVAVAVDTSENLTAIYEQRYREFRAMFGREALYDDNVYQSLVEGRVVKNPPPTALEEIYAQRYWDFKAIFGRTHQDDDDVYQSLVENRIVKIKTFSAPPQTVSRSEDPFAIADKLYSSGASWEEIGRATGWTQDAMSAYAASRSATVTGVSPGATNYGFNPSPIDVIVGSVKDTIEAVKEAARELPKLPQAIRETPAVVKRADSNLQAVGRLEAMMPWLIVGIVVLAFFWWRNR